MTSVLDRDRRARTTKRLISSHSDTREVPTADDGQQLADDLVTGIDLRWCGTHRRRRRRRAWLARPVRRSGPPVPLSSRWRRRRPVPTSASTRVNGILRRAVDLGRAERSASSSRASSMSTAITRAPRALATGLRRRPSGRDRRRRPCGPRTPKDLLGVYCVPIMSVIRAPETKEIWSGQGQAFAPGARGSRRRHRRRRSRGISTPGRA